MTKFNRFEGLASRKEPGMSSSYGPTVYCIGRNYADHAKELANPVPAEPVVFLKAASAVRPLAEGQTAHAGETFHHEAELVIRIGRETALGSTGSWELVDGLALGLDLTRREVQTKLKEKGLPWTLAKSFAGAAPVGPFVAQERFADINKIKFSFGVEGIPRQKGDTSDMLFQIPTLLTFLLKANRLVPGDLVFTGTPAGVGPLRHGESFTLAFDELGLAFTGRL